MIRKPLSDEGLRYIVIYAIAYGMSRDACLIWLRANNYAMDQDRLFRIWDEYNGPIQHKMQYWR